MIYARTVRAFAEGLKRRAAYKAEVLQGAAYEQAQLVLDDRLKEIETNILKRVREGKDFANAYIDETELVELVAAALIKRGYTVEWARINNEVLGNYRVSVRWTDAKHDR